MVLFPKNVFKLICQYCDDRIEKRQKRLWRSIVPVRSEYVHIDPWSESFTLGTCIDNTYSSEYIDWNPLTYPYQPTYDFDVYLGIRIMWNIIVLPMESEELMHPDSYIDAEIYSPWDLAVFSYNYDNQNQVEYLHIKRIEQYNSYK
tara:strand:+ start:253 stop:690 length:438 start_codon:yes stop_codon:yes gene_type:complete